MDGMSIDPYAIYVFCDAAMDYNSKNTGGVGVEIRFPDFVDSESIKISIGRYEGANIERLELEAIIQGMNELTDLFQSQKKKLNNVGRIMFITDRAGLDDKEKTSPYRIKEWRSLNWQNYEGKAIKNKNLLDRLDKTRQKLHRLTHCYIGIQYARRKYTKEADKLAKEGKKAGLVKNDIALKGAKIGKRKYDGIDVDYKLMEEKSEYLIHVYKKESVQDQWEISVEICEGGFIGRKVKIYADSEIERRLHRHHVYKVKIRSVGTHHVTIYKTIKEVKKIKKNSN